MSHTGLELSSKQSSNGGVSRKNEGAKTVHFSEEVGGLADTQSNRESEKRANSTGTAQQMEDHQIKINVQSDENRLNLTYRLTITFKLIFVNNVISTSSKGVAVLGHYSPKLLRDEEEVDVRLDESSASPRYSWLFPDKVNCCFLFISRMI